MKQPTIKFILRTNYRSVDGKRGIYLRYTQNRNSSLISLGLYTRDRHWDKKKSRVYTAAENSYNINTQLEACQKRAQDITLEYRLKNKTLTFDGFKRAFLDVNYGGELFHPYAENQIKAAEGVLGPGTLKGYRDQVNKLKSFRAQLVFEEITPSFIRSYETFLATGREKANNRNTINKSLSFLRTILNRAKKDRLISTHVFENDCKVGRIEGNRSFLTLEELKKLTDLYESGKLSPSQSGVLRYFLFACYTGLRYGDLENLRFSAIEDNKWLSIVTRKTNEPVRIPLLARAGKLLPEGSFKNQKVFRVLSNQPSNRKLKEIMVLAGIGKSISMHSARHTFATCSLDLGIPIEVVSKILGHTDLKTTAIYGRIRDGRNEEEMRKWEE